MARSVHDSAPNEYARVLRGLPALHPDGTRVGEYEQQRMFMMASFISAAVDHHSADWTDYTSASSPYLPLTVSSRSYSAPDAHVPAYMLANARGPIPDERLAAAVRAALPLTTDIFARPSLGLPEMGVWSCADCDYIADPWNLDVDERVVLADYLGVGDDSGVKLFDGGVVRIDLANPWLFMRVMDCLGWTHYANHLRAECIIFWFPSPVSAYKSAPGLWWDEDALGRRQAFKPLRYEIEALEKTGQYQFRMWKAKKMLSIAKQGIRAARYHLTRWRRNAVSARVTLVCDMFDAGRDIVDTGRALVARMDDEGSDPERLRWQESRDTHRALRREWEGRREVWSSMYLGV
ncbi:unnamed protein product [Peniophora sp. CBMAI 1063]|nr:unnamed protein product [Peniophora sp. CBMAI 1063]